MQIPSLSPKAMSKWLVLVPALLTAVLGCRKQPGVTVRVVDIFSNPSALVLAIENCSITTITNQKGQIVEGLFLDGVRIIDSKTDLDLGQGKIFVVEDPMVKGLIRSQYLELKNEAPSKISTPIYFANYENGTVLTVTASQSLHGQEFRFAHIKLRLQGPVPGPL